MVSNEMSITFPALSRNEAFARSVAAAFMAACTCCSAASMFRCSAN